MHQSMRDALPVFGICARGTGTGLGRGPVRWLSCALVVVAATPVQAQDSLRSAGAGQRQNILQPRASITESFSNNVELSRTQPRSDALTKLAAGVSFQSNAGRIRGLLDYELTGLLYARNSELNTYQNALRANLGADLIENRARVDVQAGITQSALSAFGVQPGTSGLPSSNVTELRSLSITPSFVGPLGPAVQYKAGLTYSLSDARGTTAGDTTGNYAFMQLSPSSPGVIQWTVDMSSMHTNFKAGRKTANTRLYGTLSRNIDALDLQVKASAGLEFSDINAFERARYQNWGIGATWMPSPRTKVVAQLDQRFFGNGHVLSFEHRTALTTWTFSDTRSLRSSGNGTATGGQGTTFDLYFAQFAAIEPDRAKRTDLVNSFLKANGLSAGAGSSSGFLRSSETVVRAQNASVAYRGLRGAAVLTYVRSVNVPVGGVLLPGDDFINTSSIVTDTASMSLSHRLTPMSSANLIIRYNQSRGDQPQQQSSQREINLQYLASLNERSNLTVGARRAVYNTFQSPYNESAVFATYGIRF